MTWISAEQRQANLALEAAHADERYFSYRYFSYFSYFIDAEGDRVDDLDQFSDLDSV